MLVWLLAMVVTLSFAPGDEYTRLADGSLFGWLDALTASYLLPLVALLTAVLGGLADAPKFCGGNCTGKWTCFSRCGGAKRYIAPAALLIIAALFITRLLLRRGPPLADR